MLSATIESLEDWAFMPETPVRIKPYKLISLLSC
jgi:hypothetical protein